MLNLTSPSSPYQNLGCKLLPTPQVRTYQGQGLGGFHFAEVRQVPQLGSNRLATITPKATLALMTVPSLTSSRSECLLPVSSSVLIVNRTFWVKLCGLFTNWRVYLVHGCLADTALSCSVPNSCWNR
jgi:hypothetical protein